MTVFKYALPIPPVMFGAHAFILDLPRGAEVLSFALQRDVPCIWAKVDERETQTVKREFVFAGTGHGFPDRGLRFIGTALTTDGTLVWHLFEVER